MKNMYKQKSVNSPVAEHVLQQSGGDMYSSSSRCFLNMTTKTDVPKPKCIR